MVTALLLLVVFLLCGGAVWIAWSRYRSLDGVVSRFRHENNLLRSEVERKQQEMDAMLGRLKNLVVRMDREGHVLWANPRAKALLPIPDEGDRRLSMVQMQRDPEWGDRLRQALQRLPEQSALPVLQVDNNGSGEVLSFSLQLLSLGEDQAVLLGSDISALLQQQRQREELFTNLMHDLKTPLTSLIGYSDTLATLGENSQVREEAVAAISRASRRVNRLLDGLLTLARAEQRARDESARCDPFGVVALVMDDLCDLARDRQVTLEFRHPEEGTVGALAMSKDACERVLFNVVENAINHAPAGSVVTIALRQAGRKEAQLSVADLGCGAPKEKIPHLTERFYSLDGSRTRGGHGLGLAIVAEELQRCGGKVEICNNLPSGLLVTMTIPTSLP